MWWEGTFGELKTATEKVHGRNAYVGKCKIEPGKFSTGMRNLSNQTRKWPAPVLGGRHFSIGDDLGGIGGTHGLNYVLSPDVPSALNSTPQMDH